MTENPFHRYSEAAAGHLMPVTIFPAETAPAAPATPTDRMTVDGVELAVSDRLLKLAAIRDQHRATMRAVADRRADLRERSDDLTRRLRLIDQHKYTGMSPTAVAERGQIEADLLQVRDALRALEPEASAASETFGAAQNLLRAALKFAHEHNMVVPVTLSQEVR